MCPANTTYQEKETREFFINATYRQISNMVIRDTDYLQCLYKFCMVARLVNLSKYYLLNTATFLLH